MRPEANQFVLRAAWSIAAALWAAALWMWFDIREATVAPAAVSPPLAADSVTLPTADADKPEPVLSPERVRPMAAAASAVWRQPQLVCGLESKAGMAPTEEEQQSFVEQQTRIGRERALRALQARGDAGAEAVAALLQLGAALRNEPADCQVGADCNAKLLASLQSAYQQSPQASDRLLQRAQDTDDPFVVQVALLVCDGQRNVPRGCAALSPRRLTQIDPANAAAWLELAAREAGAAEEAIHRAGLAARYDAYWGRTFVAADEALPADLSPLQRYVVINELSSVVGAFGLGSAFSASRLCSEAAVRDANRVQACERLARVMVERGRDMIERSVGLGIAARLPGTGEAWREARNRHRAGVQALTMEHPGSTVLDCGTIDQALGKIRETQRFGESAYAQRAIDRSGLSVGELVRRADAANAAFAASAASAATAASAPLKR